MRLSALPVRKIHTDAPIKEYHGFNPIVPLIPGGKGDNDENYRSSILKGARIMVYSW